MPNKSEYLRHQTYNALMRWIFVSLISGCCVKPQTVLIGSAITDEELTPVVLHNSQVDTNPCLGVAFVGQAKMPNPPNNAIAMINIANATPLTKNWPIKKFTENWYSIPKENILLCRFDKQYGDRGEWWYFKHNAQQNEMMLVEHGGWEIFQ